MKARHNYRQIKVWVEVADLLLEKLPDGEKLQDFASKLLARSLKIKTPKTP